MERDIVVDEWKVKEEYKKVLEALAIRSPVLYLFGKHLKVVYVDKEMNLGAGKAIASTDGSTIYLYRDWMSLDDRKKLLVFVHELYHVFGLHPIRLKNLFEQWKDKIFPHSNLYLLINMAADAKVNWWTRKYFVKKYDDEIGKILPTYQFNTEELEKDDVETLFEKLLQRGMSSGSGFGEASGGADLVIVMTGGGSGSDEGDGEGNVILNEGKIIGKSKEELEQEIKKAIAESILSAKNAGCRILELEAMMLDEILKNQIDWRRELKQDMLSYLKRSIVGTWIKPNRRHEMLQGHKQINRPSIWAFVDVSGSVWGDEVKQYLSEVSAAAKEAEKITVVLWDTKRTNEVVVKKPSDVKGIEIRGGGGTEFYPVISEYVEKIKPQDYVFVFTDAYWFDIQKLYDSGIMNKVRARKVLVRTTDNDRVDRLFDKVIRVEPPRR